MRLDLATEAKHEAAARLLGERVRYLLHRPGMAVENIGDTGRVLQRRGL